MPISSRTRRCTKDLTGRFGLLSLAVAGALSALPASRTLAADAYPSKPVKLIVPFAAGGSTDIVARVIAEGMRTTLGQPVIVDNKGGAGGLIGSEAIAQAAPDGYSIGMATVSTATINPLLYQRASKIEGKLLPVANLVTMPSVYMAHPKMGVNNFKDFLAKIKAQPGAYSAGCRALERWVISWLPRSTRP